MKRKLLSLLVLLMTAATGAWAETEKYLYLDLINDLEGNVVEATLKYGEPGSNPYYSYNPNANNNQGEMEWSGVDLKSVIIITVDESCKSFNGTRLDHLFSEC